MLKGFNVTAQTELLQGFKDSKMKCLLRSKAKTYQSPEGSQEGQLVLEVQGRLAWEKIKENYGVYICLPWEVWLRKWKVKEHDRTVSNTREYSVENILEMNG